MFLGITMTQERLNAGHGEKAADFNHKLVID